MKIILLQDEKKLGKKGDIIEASEDMQETIFYRKRSVWKQLPKI